MIAATAADLRRARPRDRGGCDRRLDHARDRLGARARQHVWPARARLPHHLRGFEHGELRAGHVADAGRGAVLRCSRCSSAGRSPPASSLALALCAAVGHADRALRRAAVRARRLERVADVDGRGRHRARASRDVHVRQGAAQPARCRSRARRSTLGGLAVSPLQIAIPVVAHRRRRRPALRSRSGRATARRCSRSCRTRRRRA